MSSCLSSRACGFDLEHMVNWPCSRTTSNSSSPSSTLSDNSGIAIYTQKTRTPRKRPNQTYNEAALLLSLASPTIFKIKHLTNRTTSNLLPKFTKHQPNFFNDPPELILDNSGVLLRHRIMNNPCSITELKITKIAGEIELSDGCLDDFDSESILSEEIEEGIDSIMGACKQDNNSGNDLNACYGYPMGLGFGVRNGVRALKNADERNWWRSPMVDVSPAVIGKCEKSPAGKKKKKRVEALRNVSVGNGQGLVLKLDYDGVLNEWGDKGLPLPEDISSSSLPAADIHAMVANIDLFSENGGCNESAAMRPIDKKKIRPVKNAYSDKQPRCKGRL